MNRSIRHNSIKKYCHDEEEIQMVGSLLGSKAPLKQKSQDTSFGLKWFSSVVAIHKKRFGRKTSDLVPEEVNNDEEIGFMKSMVEIQTLCNNLEQDCTILICKNCSYNQTLCTAFVFAMLLAIVSAFGSTLEHQHHQEAFETKRGLLRKQQSPQPKYNQRTLQMDQHKFILKDEYLKLQELNRNVWEVENEKRELQRKHQTLKDELLHLRQVEEDRTASIWWFFLSILFELVGLILSFNIIRVANWVVILVVTLVSILLLTLSIQGLNGSIQNIMHKVMIGFGGFILKAILNLIGLIIITTSWKSLLEKTDLHHDVDNYNYGLRNAFIIISFASVLFYGVGAAVVFQFMKEIADGIFSSFLEDP